MKEQQTQTGVSMLPEDVFTRISSRRKPIPADQLEKFKGGDLTAIPIHCVDGRPDGQTIRPCVQRLSGSFGYFVILICATRKTLGQEFVEKHCEQIVDVVLSSFGQALMYHSDNHNDDHCGCGFLRSVMNDLETFGLTTSDWNKVSEQFPKTQRVDVLDEHNEVGVIVVNTPEFILKGEEQFFVYHKYLDDIVLRILGQRVLSTLGLDLNGEEFFATTLKCRDIEPSETLKKLGADRLPVLPIA